ncbi:sll1863 family stress response protein [Jannaschia ovalis]|uniref:Uncharacterized protein n=1 Tax=Jannaschia ovalis TaxID=3038773 RepID=A0ABY8LDU2_9RHOB|nr:hypothetical protein [Jannaschia sp. GRR-S6-38]WGH78245.1 hypothetical protein P8627_14600 [Jannaschia sp. GRR-S6-38]
MMTREEYLEKARTQVRDWNAEIEKMQARMREAEAEAKTRFETNLAEMRKRRDEAEVQVKKMEKAGDQAWDDLRAGFEKSWDDMQSAFRTAMGRFK